MEGSDIIAENGLSNDQWQMLDKNWGSVAQSLRKLNLLQGYHGPYEHCHNPPSHIQSHGRRFFFDNDNINLLEIRYGSIPDQYSGKPCIWFILRHEQDLDGQISTRAQLQIWLDILENIDDKPTWVPIGRNSPDDIVNNATRHGPNTYVLAAKIFDPNEWPYIEAKIRGSARGEPFSVHIYNSQMHIKYTPGGIWVVEGILV
ncbi:hypothetical protein TMatcc_009150 [Talaromyces marneffei ATCC 18224]|nr:hypothetical protein EYB25_007294 [Talaromyces marneffei]